MSSTNGNNGHTNGKHPGGRPSRFREELCGQALKLAELGHTDAEIAAFFGISQVTLYAWSAKHPEFLKSLKLGKESSDARVERSLYHRANGYSHEAVKIFADPKSGKQKIIKFTEHYPPDTTACIFWLKNRRPAEWRERVESVQIVDDKSRIEAALTYLLEKVPGATREQALEALAPQMPEASRLVN